MSKNKKPTQTPLMKQYYGLKAKHPDAILLFRVGDFYETFGEDAIKASGILDITLTRRANGAAAHIELAGFPHHAIDTYLPKLVRAGVRVAICEQLEDPKTTKTLVKRGIIELVTPGVALDSNILKGKENSFLASVYFGAKSTGVAFLDLSTGEFYAAEGSDEYVDKLLSNLSPKEVIYQRIAQQRFEDAFGSHYYTYKLDEWVFSEQLGYDKLCKQFNTKSLKGFGIDSTRNAVAAAGAVLYYLEFTEHHDTGHINSISRIDENQYVWIDKFTMRNLELFHSNNAVNGKSFSQVIDRTSSAMGGRMLKRWIALPIKDIEQLENRYNIVEHFTTDRKFSEEFSEQLKLISDLERIGARIATERIMPREMVQLKYSILATKEICELIEQSESKELKDLAKNINLLEEVYEHIAKNIYPDPSNQLQKGGVIADGVNIELDDLRNIVTRGKEVLNDIQERESKATGIPSLKIGFNNVFGYYIEVRNTHKDKVPQGWIRKQTLTAAERYITEELKEYEEKILGAQEKMIALEQRIYADMVAYLSGYLRPLQQNATTLGQIDCLLSFAKIAIENNYARPKLNEEYALNIKGGRHPVIEKLLPVGEQYIPNDIYLDNESQQIIIVTGPNMAGKSALLRQTALIVLMAQIGCFVSAESAEIGIVDKIFTRVGASDNISQGESTFMVEMLESATILNNISSRSLLLLDEIGRGTSTYDGISIAWAMVEYIHNHASRPKTLFATHYHELNELEQLCPRVKNYNVSVKEVNKNIIFLRKLVPGGTEHSFGIHVAKMAGMPRWIVERSQKILEGMEREREHIGSVDGVDDGDNKSQGRNKTAAVLENMKGRTQARVKSSVSGGEMSLPGVQLSMFQLDDPVLKQIRDEIKGLDIDSLTPLEALNKLSEIKKITGG